MKIKKKSKSRIIASIILIPIITIIFAALHSCENDKNFYDEIQQNQKNETLETQKPTDEIIVAPNIVTTEAPAENTVAETITEVLSAEKSTETSETAILPNEDSMDLAEDESGDKSCICVKVYMSKQSDDGLLDENQAPELIGILTYEEFTEWLNDRTIEMQKLGINEGMEKRLLEWLNSKSSMTTGFNIGNITYIMELQQ